MTQPANPPLSVLFLGAIIGISCAMIENYFFGTAPGSQKNQMAEKTINPKKEEGPIVIDLRGFFSQSPSTRKNTKDTGPIATDLKGILSRSSNTPECQQEMKKKEGKVVKFVSGFVTQYWEPPKNQEPRY